MIRESSKMASVKELDIDLLDGRTNPGGEKTTDRYSVFKRSRSEYDFIFVSVPSGTIAAVINTLREENIHGTILLCCGIWQGHDYVDQQMHGFSYILGYPVAGGTIDENKLSCCVFDHFMLEKEEKTTISNYDALSQLFSDCDIKTEKPYDMLEWIWLPTLISAPVMKNMFKKNILTRNIMTLHGNTKDLLFVCKRVYEEGQQRNIKAPTFYNTYESMLSKIVRL